MNYLRQLNLFGKIADIPYDIIGETDPTTATEARSGMGYFNKISRAFFICVDDTPGAYIWIKVAGGGSSGENAGSGEPGVGITSITTVSTSDESNGVNVYAINLSDGSSYNIEVKNGSAGKDYVLTESDKAEIAEMIDVPKKLSELEADSISRSDQTPFNFAAYIANISSHEMNFEVDNINFKNMEGGGLGLDFDGQILHNVGAPQADTDVANRKYVDDTVANTRDEVTALIAAVKTYTVSVVSELPATGAEKVIYLVVKEDGSDNDAHNEYLWVNGKFEFIGTTAIDLTGYATEAWVNGKLADYVIYTELQNIINDTLAQAKESGEFDGVSPVVSVSAITGGHRITIADKDGTKTVDVMDGANGDPGRGIASVSRTSGNGSAGTTDTYTITYTDNTTSTFSVYNGADGSPGTSPTVAVSDITGGHRITITDKEGTKTVDVMDGSNGDPGDPGRGITSIVRTSGTGAAGTTDIYTITYTDNTTSTFTVYNGANGDDYTLTEADKTEIAQQAAGLVDVAGAVKVTEQTFEDTEKAQARTNIGAASADEVSELSEAIADLGGTKSMVDNAVGATYPPAQLSADSRFDDSDIYVDLYVEDGVVLPSDGATSDDIHAYIDEVGNGKPNLITKEILGKDESENFDIVRYTYCHREYCAWQKQNYPKMCAWKNGDTTLYTESVSPRIGEKAYDVPYVKETNTQTVTKPKFTNLKEQCVYKYEQRWTMSGGAWKAFGQNNGTTILVPVPTGSTSVTVRLKGVTPHESYTAVYGGADAVTLTESCIPDGEEFNDSYLGSDGVYAVPCTKSETTAYISFNVTGTSESDFTDIIVTVDEPIEYETVEEEIEGEAGTPITAVSATNRSRTIGGVVYTRYEDGDVNPTLIYTDVYDDRNASETITKGGITYIRYPLGDLLANKTKPVPIFVYANEHGTRNMDAISNGTNETKLCALVAARLLRDLGLDKQSKNPLYKFIRENCMLIVIPVVNVYGFNHYVTDKLTSGYDSYRNANAVNINRNYDCPGWDVMSATESYWMGEYPGSENETQYVMNTMVESGAVVAMSLHGIGGMLNTCRHQGQNPGGVDYNQEKLAKVNDIIYKNYGLQLLYYDYIDGEPARCVNTPDITSKSPSFITQCGAYGGIVEFQPVKAGGAKGEQYLDSNVVECAYVQMINLMAMWLSDYLDNQQ